MFRKHKIASRVPLFFQKPNWSSARLSSIFFSIRPKIIFVKNEERVVNAFETWCWRRILKIKRTDRITNDVVQRAKEERLLSKI
jgi:hypothetical protein